MDRVRGTLPKQQSNNLAQFQSKIEQLGYELAEEKGKISFTKVGKLEAILTEIMPLAEESGWNVEQDLYLEETNAEKAASSIYQEGRTLRLFPRF